MKVVPIRGEHTNWNALLAQVQEEFPALDRAIVVVFDEEGDMHMYLRAANTQIALAGARLTYLAGKDDD